MKIEGKRAVLSYTLLFTFLYFTSYLTRINYAAVITEMVAVEGVQKSLASLALTASAVTYGCGQLLSGFLGDRVEPKLLIFAGLLTTITMNLLLPFAPSPYVMAVIWGVNGVAQAFMWPPLVKIMSSLFFKEDYNRACVVVSFGSSLGTMAVYLLAPLCIALGGWRFIFYASAACALLMAVIWLWRCPRVQAPAAEVSAAPQEKARLSFGICALLGAVMLSIALQGVLRDGVTTWTPSYITETFHLDNKVAILTMVVMPIFSILTIQLTSFIYRRLIHSELLLAGVMFAVGFAAGLALYLTNGISPVLSVLFAAVLIGCMHGVNWVQTCMVPPTFARFGNICFVSGLLNFSTYIGSAASAYGIAAFSERCGWDATLLLWSGVALLGALLCLSLVAVWGRFKKENPAA